MCERERERERGSEDRGNKRKRNMYVRFGGVREKLIVKERERKKKREKREREREREKEREKKREQEGEIGRTGEARGREKDSTIKICEVGLRWEE